MRKQQQRKKHHGSFCDTAVVQAKIPPISYVAILVIESHQMDLSSSASRCKNMRSCDETISLCRCLSRIRLQPQIIKAWRGCREAIFQRRYSLSALFIKLEYILYSTRTAILTPLCASPTECYPGGYLLAQPCLQPDFLMILNPEPRALRQRTQKADAWCLGVSGMEFKA